MLKFLINLLGKILSLIPTPILAGLTRIAGYIIYFTTPSRRRILLSNLYHAFPQKSESWRRKIARTSCARMIEMGLFVLASPFLSKKRTEKTLIPTDSYKKYAEIHNRTTHPLILLLPHFSLTEALNLYTFHYEGKELNTGIIFRPFRNKAINQWVKDSRERFGLKLLSRKEGFFQAVNILKSNGIIGILFDQNAGTPGSLTTFFDRLASTTELPDMLYRKFETSVAIMFTERTSFWKAKLRVHALPQVQNGTPISILANEWLENKLKENDNYCADWLWYHNRWSIENRHVYRLHLSTKRNILAETLHYKKQTQLPKKTKFYIRLPNWLGDVVMALPLIRAIKKARPDASITLISQKAYATFLTHLNIADKIISLPKKDYSYYFSFFRYRKEYPDLHFLFTNSLRGDLEARIIGAPQRFGMLRAGKKRPFLTDVWNVPANIDERENHQTHVWLQCLRYFGLKEEIDYTSYSNLFNIDVNKKQESIGLICGTENSPEKRWPINHWRQLINLFLKNHPELNIYLFGTPRDKEVTSQVSEGFDANKVINLAGKTSLNEFSEHLANCQVIICNDTGGMHLANALGTPVIAIFGPTNPVRTGPIFNSPKIILQPKNCPPTGGANISEVEPEEVLQAYKKSSGAETQELLKRTS